ncbi:hypothetical protein [Novosphingobium capsulatum]|uniref:hypothetical protein n=1 Tax=Novosphingobium capsulatum TaxID=13688 RepID=UPI00142F3953|nr:hypothetical protein [Novosphingobium capsulatum]WQD92768.1 hypothetical protein U0041_17565 [Novosphingobium capsulatum]
MSYHDRNLQKAARAVRKRGTGAYFDSVLRGIGLITLHPPSPNIPQGSIGGDWRAVGNDMRKAMRELDTCE